MQLPAAPAGLCCVSLTLPLRIHIACGFPPAGNRECFAVCCSVRHTAMSEPLRNGCSSASLRYATQLRAAYALPQAELIM